jgi:hypothetical protein
MLRNVVIAHLKDGTSDQAVETLMSAMKGLRIPGLVEMTIGRDLGLREGNAGIAIVSDLADEDAYAAYDADPEHNRIRRELVAPIAERVERCQFRL